MDEGVQKVRKVYDSFAKVADESLKEEVVAANFGVSIKIAEREEGV